MKGYVKAVVICFQISIFEPLETTYHGKNVLLQTLWFAFKLVSLNHWKQLLNLDLIQLIVVICFQISIFEPLETTLLNTSISSRMLWFAFKLVSLNHWKQHKANSFAYGRVVICFQISIFEPLETTVPRNNYPQWELWFAFKLVSLNHWKQRSTSSNNTSKSCDLLSN